MDLEGVAQEQNWKEKKNSCCSDGRVGVHHCGGVVGPSQGADGEGGNHYSRVANFDETNVAFGQVANTTISPVGVRQVSIRSSAVNGSSHRCSVMLGVSTTGHKFPPFVIFQGKPGKIVQDECTMIQRFASEDGLNIHLTVQNKGWMDSQVMLEWAAAVWAPWANDQCGRCLLILDEFTGHRSAELRAFLEDNNTSLIFIPGGYTSKLQVMDVGLNKPFKDRVRKAHNHWFTRCYKSGTRPKAAKADVTEWIAKAWDGISMECIFNSWRHVGADDWMEYSAEETTIGLDGLEEIDESGVGSADGDEFWLAPENDENNNNNNNDLLQIAEAIVAISQF
jgi:DDE superfamily endonuclease